MATPGTASAFADPMLMQRLRSTNPAPAWTNPSNSVTGAYGAAVNQNAQDYDRLQGQYKTLFDQAQSGRTANQDISIPKVEGQQRQFNAIPAYQRTSAMDSVMGQLQGFADTGGYSSDDINAFRSRGLSPIRSIYASALKNLQRQKAIQGGYSPNYGAMQAKLAREQSGIIGQHTMDLNANIAERVAEGKRFGLSNLSPLASQEQAATNAISAANAQGMNEFESANVAEVNRISELNARLMMEAENLNRQVDDSYMQQALAATSGGANLYGTTPALTNMFGNQVLQSNAQNLQAQTAEGQLRQARAGTGAQLVGMGATQRPINYGSTSWAAPTYRFG